MQKVTLSYASPFTQIAIDRHYYLPSEEKQFDAKCDELKDRKIAYVLTFTEDFI